MGRWVGGVDSPPEWEMSPLEEEVESFIGDAIDYIWMDIDKFRRDWDNRGLDAPGNWLRDLSNRLEGYGEMVDGLLEDGRLEELERGEL